MNDDQLKALAALREPFPPEQIGKLPKGGAMLDFVGHAALTARLLSVDPDVPPLPLGGGRDPVQFLRAVPITANEAAWVRLKGAAALREAWSEAGVDVTDPARGGVNPT